MNAENLQQRILKVVAETLDSNPSTIQPEHELRQDIGCDSLDCVEIMMALENEFEIEIDDDKFETCTTMQDVINYVAGVCNPPLRTPADCTSHHHACACREHKIAVASKAAQNVTIELDWLKNEFPMTDEKRDTIQQTVERCHAALNDLAADTATHDTQANAQGGPGWAAL